MFSFPFSEPPAAPATACAPQNIPWDAPSNLQLPPSLWEGHRLGQGGCSAQEPTLRLGTAQEGEKGMILQFTP